MFSDVANHFVGDDLQDIEVDGFGEGSALSDDNNVPLLDGECGRAVHRDVAVPFLVAVVFGHKVQVVPPDNDGPLHFGGDADALEDLAPDGDLGGEGAFLIDVLALDGLLGGFEAQPDALEVPDPAA